MAKQVLPVNFTDDLLAESMDGKRKYRIIDNDDGTVSLEDVSEYLQMGSVFGAGQINSTNQAVNESVDKDKILKTLEEVSASTDSDAVVGRGAVAELNQNMNAHLNNDGGIITAESLEKAVAILCDRCTTPKDTYMGTFIYNNHPYIYKIVYISVGDWMGEISKHSWDGSNPYAFVRTAGADAVLKKLGNQPPIKLGTARSYTLTSYPDYKKYTADNFLCECLSGSSIKTKDNNESGTYTFHGGATYTPITKSYNASTGVLTISGGTIKASIYRNNVDQGMSQTSNLTVTTWLIP